MRDLLFVAIIEVIMTLFISYFIIYTYRKRDEFTFKTWALVTVLLVMMASMLNSITYYLATPKSFLNTIIAVNFSMLSMASVIILIFWFAVTKKDYTFDSKSKNTFVLLLLWNEISMGILVYYLAFGTPYLNGNLLEDLINLFSLGINGYLFIIPMAIEMLVFMFVVKPGRAHRNILASLLSMSVLSPILLGSDRFVGYGLFGITAVMVFFMIILFESIAKGRTSLTLREMKDLSYLFFIFTLMTIGVFLGSLFNKPFGLAWSFFALAMVSGMAFYFKSSLNQTSEIEKRTGWKNRPRFLFWILMASFISEWFSAAAIIFHFYSPVKPGGFSNFMTFSNMLGGVSVFNPLSTFVDLVYLIGAVTNGFVFLSIMGIEMGSLVIFKMRESQWKEKRVNLAMALTAFALYTIFWPNFGNTSLYGTLPVWANVGSLEPLYPAVLLALVGSYILYAVLALLFGRRSYCSTLCPSAVMYGGTLGQSMISYNYESKISKKHIGSRYKSSILTIIYNFWIVMVVVSLLSYFTNLGSYSISIFGIDTSVYFSYFVWNFMWYGFFIAIPFIGMSPCRRYGWCTTGTFVGFFSKIGLFKLKVKSSDMCVTCPTKDCVTSCEVGLGDLAKQFIQNGSFNSSKCVGAGSCVQACPYDNIYFYDVRNAIKEKFGSGKN